MSRLPTMSQLLAVAAIVAFIAAIFVPVFTRPDRHTRGTCMSNEKQLGLGLMQYIQDSSGLMPSFADAHGNTWRTAIYPYVKNATLFQCPDRDLADNAANPHAMDGYAPSYAANASDGRGAFSGPGAPPVAVAAVPAPSTLIALMETSHNANPGYDIDNPAGFGPGSKTLWAGHQGHSVYLFLDGHAKLLRPAQTFEALPGGRGTLNEWCQSGARPLSANGVAVLRDAQRRFQQ